MLTYLNAIKRLSEPNTSSSTDVLMAENFADKYNHVKWSEHCDSCRLTQGQFQINYERKERNII